MKLGLPGLAMAMPDEIIIAIITAKSVTCLLLIMWFLLVYPDYSVPTLRLAVIAKRVRSIMSGWQHLYAKSSQKCHGVITC
jgi:hypothetical protein